MSAFLSLVIRFHSSEYYGGYWPPSPGTVFQALVSGALAGGHSELVGQPIYDALYWLESLEPPSVCSKDAPPQTPYPIFVPPNNMEVAVRNRTNPRALKVRKQVQPKRIQSHSSGAPDAVYFWPLSPAQRREAIEHLQVLDHIAAQLYALGWGVDFATAQFSISDTEQLPGMRSLVPGASGSEPRQVPTSGTLDSLQSRFQLFRARITSQGVNPAIPPPLMREVFYMDPAQPNQRRYLAFSLVNFQNPASPFCLTPEHAIHAAAWLRHRAAESLLQEGMDQKWVASYIQGHTPDDRPGYRLSYLPLPSIGAAHADGLIRRVLVQEPTGAVVPVDAEALELLRITLAGGSLTRENAGLPHALLNPLMRDDSVLPHYCGRAKFWSTVTPVVLHGFNVLRSSVSVSKTRKLLLQAFEAAGLPEHTIAELSYQTAPFWPRLPSASEFLVPAHLSKWPRLHVSVTFHDPLPGPIVVGLGRHFGLGLFGITSAR